MEEYGFVYIWRDRKHKRYYIGAHWGHINDSYICSSPWMRQAYKKRPSDFKRRILITGFSDKKSMFLREAEIFKCIKPEEVGKRYYNLSIKQGVHWSATCNASTIAKKSGMTRRGIKLGPHTEATKRLMSEKKKGIKFTPEHREKMANSRRGKSLSEQHKAKISAGLLKAQTPELIQRRSEKNRGQRRKINYCLICNEDTGHYRRKFCVSHRYEGMNITRSYLPNTKWEISRRKLENISN